MSDFDFTGDIAVLSKHTHGLLVVPESTGEVAGVVS